MTGETLTQTPRKRRRWNWLSIALFASGLALLIAVPVILFTGVFSGSTYSGPGYAEDFGPSIVHFQAPATSTPAPSPTAVPSGAPIQRLTIPKYNVDAPIIVLGVDENGVMEAPEDPWDVAWYDFTGHPGRGSNAVFSGHVDWTFDTGPAGAAFWDLQNLVQGDLIEVALEDGTVYQYSVISRELVDPTTVDVQSIVGPTSTDVVTLITCGGTFNTATGHYTSRTVVRAERIVEDAPGEEAPANAAGSP